MAGAAGALYEPLIERDLDAIPAAVRRFRDSHSSDELFLAVARFAVLAYAPSSHSRHALLACLSARDVRDAAGERYDDLLTECARYAAESRRPWSEPPLLDPPVVDPAPAGARELRAALEARDATGAEAWLARRHQDDDVVRDLMDVACDHPGEMGHSVIVTRGMARMADLLGEKGSFAVLRVAVWEMLAAEREEQREVPPEPASDDALLDRLIARSVAEAGSLEGLHGVFLFDAALQAGVLDRVRSRLPVVPGDSVGTPAPAMPAVPIYRLARDYGACLKAHAVATRLRHPGIPALVAAAHRNLREGESFEEWSLA